VERKKYVMADPLISRGRFGLAETVVAANPSLPGASVYIGRVAPLT
jgi:hypothetical protein